MKDDYTTNSHYLTYTFLFRKVGRMYFLNLGVKGLKSKRQGPQIPESESHSTEKQIATMRTALYVAKEESLGSHKTLPRSLAHHPLSSGSTSRMRTSTQLEIASQIA